jgi:DNA-binding transcriptional MerR regulator
MTGSAARASGVERAPASEHDLELLTGRWPHSLSHEPLLRVSDVLALIQSEFPTLTPSKLRFYDAQGLVSPQRTASGYRQYSPADVERLQFVLRQQRDHYRPLTIIAQHLEALDRGTMHERVSPHAVDGEDDDFLSAVELAARAGTTEASIADLSEAGIIRQSVPGAFDRGVLDLVVACGAYLAAGGDVRSLRSLCLAARREADRADAVVAPVRGRGAVGEADESARELGESAVAVFGACVRGSLNR